MKQDKLIDAIGMIKDEYIEEAHETRKKRSFSWVWAKRIALGLCCVLLAVTIVPRFFAGKSGSTNTSYEYAGEDGLYYEDVEYAYTVEEEGFKTTSTANNLIQENKKLIVTAYMTLETMNLDDVLDELNNEIASCGGYVQSSSIYNYSSRRSYEACIRIPADSYSDFVKAVKASGNAASFNESVEDITNTYTDLQARINSLKAEEEKVLEFYKEAKDLEELMLVEERLTEIRYEIDSKEAQMKNYDLLTAYSTLHLTINETKEYTPVSEDFFTKLGNSFKNGWNNFVSSIENLIIDIAYDFWSILLLILICFGGYKLFRFIRKKHNK